MFADLSPEQKQLQQSVLAFARSAMPGSPSDDGSSDPNTSGTWRDRWNKCADFGVFGYCVPLEFGGSDQGILNTVLALEALGKGCSDNGLTLSINGQIWAVQTPLIAFGTSEQKARYLPGFCSGSIIGSHGLTEHDSGSDAMAMATTAERSRNGYVLNGEKAYVGLGPECDLALIFASTSPEHKQWGISAFLVEAGDNGFTRGPWQSKMGLCSTPMGSLTFQDCWIPEDRRLGPEGAGFSIFQHTMEWERSFIFASHVGAMARQLEECTAFARSRSTFGQPIIDHQSVSNRLADMTVRLETSRLLLYRLACLKDNERPALMEAAIAKLHISEAYVASSLDAMRIHGGKGYLTEHGVEGDLRDALAGVIYSGTSDIQRQIISRLLK